MRGPGCDAGRPCDAGRYAEPMWSAVLCVFLLRQQVGGRGFSIHCKRRCTPALLTNYKKAYRIRLFMVGRIRIELMTASVSRKPRGRAILSLKATNSL